MTIFTRNPKGTKDENGKDVSHHYVAVKIVRGKHTSDIEGPFYYRMKTGSRGFPKLSAMTYPEAVIEAERKEKGLDAIAEGFTVPELQAGATSLKASIAAYIVEIKANRSPATWDAYRSGLNYFLNSCKKVSVAEVNRADMLEFKAYLKKEGFSERSIFNHFQAVTFYFVWAKGRNALGLKKADRPSKPKPNPDAYTEEELKKLLLAAAGTFRGLERGAEETHDDRLLLQSFLNTGLRDGELSNLTYDDIDSKISVWRVRPKENHPLKTPGSERDVPVAEWLTKAVLAQKKADERGDKALIFPSARGGVDGHLIRIIHRIADLAGVTGKVTDHKFRATAITMWLRAGNTIPDVMGWVGHVKPDTILWYYKKLKLENPEERHKATGVFASLVGVGD